MAHEASFIVTDTMDVSLGFLAVAVTPALPELPPGSSLSIVVTKPTGSVLDARCMLEYTKRPPFKPALLMFAGLSKVDIPLGSKLAIVEASRLG
jgi:hypothetical protein